ncbi:MAG: hypothetical protein LBR26_10985 [Prevotella sp.]|jgi:hypothetical protein|nr:hypothetical protein [Prevotella sp.]
MALIQEITETESLANDRIHLYLEGIFWKAYQRSAYRMVEKNGKLKVSKKRIKSLGQDVVSIGFPDTALSKYFGEQDYERVGDRHISVKNATVIDEEDYKRWFSGIELSVPATPVAPAAKIRENGVPLPSAVEESVIKQLREFRLEESTPLECLAFLAELRKKLAC